MRDKLAAIQAERVRQAQAAQAKLEEEKQRQARRLAMLEELASTETVIERHSRWFALVPFGAGQFQNGQTAEGWLFLIGEGLLAGGSVVASGLSVYYGQQRNVVANTDPATAERLQPARRSSRPSPATCSRARFVLTALERHHPRPGDVRAGEGGEATAGASAAVIEAGRRADGRGARGDVLTPL